MLYLYGAFISSFCFVKATENATHNKTIPDHHKTHSTANGHPSTDHPSEHLLNSTHLGLGVDDQVYDYPEPWWLTVDAFRNSTSATKDTKQNDNKLITSSTTEGHNHNTTVNTFTKMNMFGVGNISLNNEIEDGTLVTQNDTNLDDLELTFRGLDRKSILDQNLQRIEAKVGEETREQKVNIIRQWWPELGDKMTLNPSRKPGPPIAKSGLLTPITSKWPTSAKTTKFLSQATNKPRVAGRYVLSNTDPELTTYMNVTVDLIAKIKNIIFAPMWSNQSNYVNTVDFNISSHGEVKKLTVMFNRSIDQIQMKIFGQKLKEKETFELAHFIKKELEDLHEITIPNFEIAINIQEYNGPRSFRQGPDVPPSPPETPPEEFPPVPQDMEQFEPPPGVDFGPPDVKPPTLPDVEGSPPGADGRPDLQIDDDNPSPPPENEIQPPQMEPEVHIPPQEPDPPQINQGQPFPNPDMDAPPPEMNPDAQFPAGIPVFHPDLLPTPALPGEPEFPGGPTLPIWQIDQVRPPGSNSPGVPPYSWFVRPTPEPMEPGEHDERDFAGLAKWPSPYGPKAEIPSLPGQYEDQMRAEMFHRQMGYFSIFLINVCKIFTSRTDGVARLIAIALVKEFEKLSSDHNTLASFGDMTKLAMQNITRVIQEIPPAVAKSQALVLLHDFGSRREHMSSDLNSLIEYIDTLYNEEEGGRLFNTLAILNNYPKSQENIFVVVSNVLDAVLTPYRRMPHEAQQIFRQSLETLVVRYIPKDKGYIGFGRRSENLHFNELEHKMKYSNKTRFSIVQRENDMNNDKKDIFKTTGLKHIYTVMHTFANHYEKPEYDVKKASRNVSLHKDRRVTERYKSINRTTKARGKLQKPLHPLKTKPQKKFIINVTNLLLHSEESEQSQQEKEWEKMFTRKHITRMNYKRYSKLKAEGRKNQQSHKNYYLDNTYSDRSKERIFTKKAFMKRAKTIKQTNTYKSLAKKEMMKTANEELQTYKRPSWKENYGLPIGDKRSNDFESSSKTTQDPKDVLFIQDNYKYNSYSDYNDNKKIAFNSNVNSKKQLLETKFKVFGDSNEELIKTTHKNKVTRDEKQIIETKLKVFGHLGEEIYKNTHKSTDTRIERHNTVRLSTIYEESIDHTRSDNEEEKKDHKTKTSRGTKYSESSSNEMLIDVKHTTYGNKHVRVTQLNANSKPKARRVTINYAPIEIQVQFSKKVHMREKHGKAKTTTVKLQPPRHIPRKFKEETNELLKRINSSLREINFYNSKLQEGLLHMRANENANDSSMLKLRSVSERDIYPKSKSKPNWQQGLMKQRPLQKANVKKPAIKVYNVIDSKEKHSNRIKDAQINRNKFKNNVPKQMHETTKGFMKFSRKLTTRIPNFNIFSYNLHRGKSTVTKKLSYNNATIRHPGVEIFGHLDKRKVTTKPHEKERFSRPTAKRLKSSDEIFNKISNADKTFHPPKSYFGLTREKATNYNLTRLKFGPITPKFKPQAKTFNKVHSTTKIPIDIFGSLGKENSHKIYKNWPQITKEESNKHIFGNLDSFEIKTYTKRPSEDIFKKVHLKDLDQNSKILPNLKNLKEWNDWRRSFNMNRPKENVENLWKLSKKYNLTARTGFEIIRRFNINFNDSIANRSNEIVKYDDKPKRNKIRYLSSYSDEENALKFNLNDAIRHHDINIDNIRRHNINYHKHSAIDKLASNSNEEVILKSKIYRAFQFGNFTDNGRRENNGDFKFKRAKFKPVNVLSSYSDEESVIKDKLFVK